MCRCYCEGYGVCFAPDLTLEDWTEWGKRLDKKWSRYLLIEPMGQEVGSGDEDEDCE